MHYEIKLKFIFTQLLCYRQDEIQGHFFKQSKAGLNSEFDFSYTNYLSKAKEPILSYYLPIAGRRKKWIHGLSQRHKCKVKSKYSHPGFELGSPNSFPMMITIILKVAPTHQFKLK